MWLFVTKLDQPSSASEKASKLEQRVPPLNYSIFPVRFERFFLQNVSESPLLFWYCATEWIGNGRKIPKGPTFRFFPTMGLFEVLIFWIFKNFECLFSDFSALLDCLKLIFVRVWSKKSYHICLSVLIELLRRFANTKGPFGCFETVFQIFHKNVLGLFQKRCTLSLRCSCKVPS